MKDEETVRVLEQGRKTNEYKAYEGYRIKQAQLYEGKMQIIVYGDDDYKILAMEFQKGAEMSVIEDKKFLSDYGANIGLMMLMSRERMTIDYEMRIDTTEDDLIQIDRAGYFFAVKKMKEKQSKPHKLIFTGEMPKAGGFEPKKILYEVN